jgi:hypothetical protein
MKKEFLDDMKTHPLWPEIKKALGKMRPVVPSHDPKIDNTDIWKSLSAQQKGFDLCCAFFEINKE